MSRLIVWLAIFFLVLPACGWDHEGRQRGLRLPDRHKVGDVAPDFQLKTKDGTRAVKLSSFRGKRPVVLIFGSYT